MKKASLYFLTMIFLTIIIFALPDIVHAIPGLGYMGSGPTVRINHIVRVSPRPPGWPQKWLMKEIIKSFNDNGVNIDQTGELVEDDIDLLPADIKYGVKIAIHSNERIQSGCVLEFDEKRNFEKVKEHYLELNSKGNLHTWTLVKDNILVVIEGAMPEKEIQAYKAVLMNIK